MIIGTVLTNNLGTYITTKVGSINHLIKVQLRLNTCLADIQGEDRRIDHFRSIQFLQYDFDQVSTSPEELTEVLLGVRHYILTSKSDGKNGMRNFHLFVPVKTITSNEEYKENWDHFLEMHPLPCDCDEKAKDSVRLFFKHKGIGSVHMGRDIPLFSLQPHEVESRLETTTVIPFCGDMKSLPKSNPDRAMSYYLAKHPKCGFDLRTDGKRWSSMLFVVGVLVKMGVCKESIMEYLDSNSRYEEDPERQFTRCKVIAHIGKFFE